MVQIHNNFSDDQVKQLLAWYIDGTMSRQDICLHLGLKQSRFYELLKAYKTNPSKFSVAYGRDYANYKKDRTVTATIHKELELEKSFIDNPNMPIMFYNYSAIRDAIEENTSNNLSSQTVVNYAKKWGFYIERPKNKNPHTRQVLTDSVGMLLQHDASTHQWSPYAFQPDGKPLKWSLITTLDDHSRKLLFADLFEHKSAWAHIQALESVILYTLSV